MSDDPLLRNQFSIFDVPSDDWDSLRRRVEVINKLVRRYKYMQIKLDDVLVHLLQYINKFGDNAVKLAEACGVLFALQLASLPILAGLFKEHLVKDGTSLNFITQVFTSYLREMPLDHLNLSLKKSGVGNKLFDFFPVNKRTNEHLAAHFEEHGLKSLVDHHLGMLQRNIKDVTRAHVTTMFKENSPVEDVVSYAKNQLTTNSWAESDLVPIIWDSFIESIEWGGKAEQIDVQIVKALNNWAAVFVPFCSTPKTELNLMLQIQIMCYEDARFMKFFVKMIQFLYKHDVLSDGALIYWFEKGAASQGKTVFLKQMEAFVAWVKAQEDDSEEDE